ncbi:hypothetical protein EXIGLDRAFT_752712 [Exidia glandulosa HHB12029]|uniref:Uncharacterized protein n=1 Tax=Exidia glandulosa HHB12029 TaxID=1314781 RepID=A0A165ECT7_EXIGL|nr:hypothetical protein EXIGLDRAFT_752712 [Exidia glandulosa HHB12029]
MRIPLNVTDAPLSCTASPASNGTLLCAWTGSSGTRGTFNIIWLCLSTLGLCVWNAMHPDVPRPGKSRGRILARRLWWLVVGLFMPEMLVLVALAQFLAAYRLLIRVNNETKAPTSFPWWMTKFEQFRSSGHHANTERDGRRHPWTLTHSFYAVSRGYVNSYGTDLGADKIIERMDLSPDNPKRMPDLSAHDIDDRSKADGLAKLLLVWQLSVFLANCAARWEQELPLSLFEITTLAHSLCSLAALAFWWYKPHRVGEATVVNPKKRATRADSPLHWPSWRDITIAVDSARRKFQPDPSIGVPQFLTALTIAILYGLPHLLGRTAHFPTVAERMVWRIATYAVIASPLVTCIVALFIPLPPKPREPQPERFFMRWVRRIPSAAPVYTSHPALSSCTKACGRSLRFLKGHLENRN